MTTQSYAAAIEKDGSDHIPPCSALVIASEQKTVERFLEIVSPTTIKPRLCKNGHIACFELAHV